MQDVNRYDFTLSDEEIAAGVHRTKVGRDWEGTGKLQQEFLVAHGLAPTSKLLDVGCGALRAGILLAKYLQPGGYHGIDVNQSLIRAALVHELPLAGLEDRVPAENLRVTDRFECDFGVAFDFAIAQSVFTHLPLNHIRLCLYQLAGVMAPGGRLFASFFEVPAHAPHDQTVQQRARTTWPERDPFHYRRSDLRWAAESVADWQVRYIGGWGHRRGQRMMEYTLRSRGRDRASQSTVARSSALELRRRARRTVAASRIGEPLRRDRRALEPADTAASLHTVERDTTSRPRVVFVLAHAWGSGGTIRSVFALSEALAATHDVRIVSVVRTRPRPALRRPRDVRLHAVDDLRQDRGVVQRLLRRRPSRLFGHDPALAHHASLWTDLRFIRTLRRLKTDVVITTRPSITAATVRHRPKARLVGQEHVNLTVRRRGDAATLLQTYAGLDCLVTLTEEDRASCGAALDGVPVACIPNAVPALPQATAEREPTVLAVGRLVHANGFARLIDAFALVADRHPEWTLRICGDGPSRPPLRRRIRRRGLRGRVELLGDVRRVERQYARASVFAMSSRFEGMPMVLLEAMAAGLPAVAMGCPTGPGTLIADEQTGLLTPADDVQALAAGLDRLMGDAALRARLGEAAQKRADTYSAASVAAAWRDVLDALLAVPGPSAHGRCIVDAFDYAITARSQSGTRSRSTPGASPTQPSPNS